MTPNKTPWPDGPGYPCRTCRYLTFHPKLDPWIATCVLGRRPPNCLAHSPLTHFRLLEAEHNEKGGAP